MEQDCNALTPPTEKELRDVWVEDAQDPAAITHLEDAEEIGANDHGYSYTRYFYRIADGSFWCVSGVRQSHGDYDSLRDEASDTPARRVYPHRVTKTIYKGTPP